MFKKFTASALLIFAFTSLSNVASAEETLYSRLGGTYAIAQVVDHLVDLIYINKGLNANPALSAIHIGNPGSKAGFKQMVTNWTVQETGGPKVYLPDSFGRGKSLKESHPHLNISDREFDIIKTLALASFYQYNVGNHEIDQLMDDLETYRKVIVTNTKAEGFTSRLKRDGVEYRTK